MIFDFWSLPPQRSSDRLGLLCGVAVALLLSTGLRKTRGQGRTNPPAQYARSQWTSVERGLPSNDIRKVLQTDDGYLWLGTMGGLARFDGMAFEETRLTRLEGRRRVNDRVLDVQAYDDGLLVLYRSRDLFHYRVQGEKRVADSVWTYQVGTNGQVWLGSGRDVLVYQNDETIDRITTVGSTIRALHRTGDGTLWIGTKDGGLYRRTPGGERAHLTAGDGLLANQVLSFAEDAGTVLIGTAAGLQRWNDGQLTEIPSPDPAESLQVVGVRGDVKGTCWAQTPRAVYRCDSGRLRSYQKKSSREQRPKYLSGDFVQVGAEGHLFVNTGRTLYRDGVPIFETEFAIRSFTQDREGTLWIGTGSRGLFQLRPSTVTVYGTEAGLPHDMVTTITQRRDGSVWMGTRPGALVHFREGTPVSYRLQKAGKPLRPIFTLHEDRSGQLWVGGTRLCQVENGQCARPDRPGPIPRTLITSIHEDRKGRLWVGTLGRGLYRRSAGEVEGKGGWSQFTPKNSALPSREIRWILETPTGDLWFAAVGGEPGQLARYRNGTFAVLPDSLTSKHPSFLYQDTTDTGAPGVLWMGTTEYGLNRIDLRGAETLAEASVTKYRKRDGLYHNTIYQVLGDGQGRLWISTPDGIFWVEKSALEAMARGERSRVHSVVYTTRDGLRNVEGNGFGVPGAVRGQDGRLWFPNQAGAVVVDPSTVPVNAPPPRMHVEAIRSGDSLVTDAPGSTVALGKNQRTFSVEYTGIRMGDSKALEFRYRLAGLQEEWIPAGSRREAFFTEVPPGTYTFEVAGRTRTGPWSTEPAQITLTVEPFFYETWWFYGLCALALGLMGAGLVRYRFYALRRRKERLRQQVDKRTEELARAKQQAEEALDTVAEQAEQLRRLDEMKSRFFANVSHELRTPLSLILGPVRQMIEEERRPDEERETLQIVSRNAERLQRLVEQLLDLARYDAGHLDLALERKPWGPFVEQAVQRLVPMAERQGATLSVETEEAGRPVAFDPDHMETVIANLVRNALRYAPQDGTVAVEAAVTGEEASLRVRDTGPGIPEEEREHLFERFYRGARQTQTGGTGIGLALTKALVLLHEGTIEVDSTLGEGSTFAVRWPVGLQDEREAGGVSEEPEAGPPFELSGEESVASDGGSGVPTEDTVLISESSSPTERIEEGVPTDRTTVLVVDDNADVRRYVRSLLEPRYRVIEAENGSEGLERTRRALPDLVVADVMMPEMDGFEMVRELRRSARTECIPVVMLTARAEEADRVEGLEEGAEAYVTKPFDAEMLTAQIDSLITARRQLRERFEEEVPASADSFGTEPAEAKRPESFEERARRAVEAHLSDPDFSVGQLAEEVGLAQRTLTRKVKEAFGETPSDLIRAMRLERGAELLDEGAGTISEVAYAVGFNSLSYFSRSFKDYFGVTPSTYQKKEA